MPLTNDYLLSLNFDIVTFCYSTDTKLIAFTTKTHLYIADSKRKIIIKKIFTDKDELTILAFNPSSQYIVAGSKTGIVYLYNLNLKLSKLYSFEHQKAKNNFITSINFYKNLVAVSDYNGIIFIVDIYSRANETILLHDKSSKKVLCFLDENIIISGDNQGNLQFIIIQSNTVIKSINLPFGNIKQILPIPDTKYLLIYSSTNIISIVDSKNYKLLYNNYLNFNDYIEYIEVFESHTLTIYFKNQKRIFIELPNTDKLKSLIIHNSLDKAFALIEKEPILQDTQEHRLVQNLYMKSYRDATDALINNNIDLANQIMSLFKDVRSQKDSINTLFKSFKNYDRFKVLYHEQKYALCFAMSLKFPPLKATKEYKDMEVKWRDTFIKAQKKMQKGELEVAKSLFKDYITVTSKRPLIQLILKHNEQFIDFLKAFEQKDFKKINEISLKNKLFTQIPIYKTLDSEMEKSITTIEVHIKNDEIDLAIECLKNIKVIPKFNKKLKYLHSVCHNMQKLHTHYERNDFYSCYELIDSYPYLYSTQLGELLQIHWSKLMQKCEYYSSKGDIQSIKTALGELIKLKGRKVKIEDLLKVGFLMQIKQLLSEKSFNNAQTIIYLYIDTFTKDDDIEALMQEYETTSDKRLAITQTVF